MILKPPPNCSYFVDHDGTLWFMIVFNDPDRTDIHVPVATAPPEWRPVIAATAVEGWQAEYRRLVRLNAGNHGGMYEQNLEAQDAAQDQIAAWREYGAKEEGRAEG